MTFEDKFKQAGIDGKEFRGAPFWSWNDDLDPEELKRQVRSMCESGMGGFFMHARSGLVTPYMSKEYFECHQACIDEAKKLGMDAWLYDEDCWPSGSGGNVSESKGTFYQSKLLRMDKVVGGKAHTNENTIVVYRYESDGDNVTAFERVPVSALTDATGDNLLHCYWSADSYVDVLSKEAIAQFIDNTHDAFAKVFQSEFGKSIPGIFTDEPNYNHIAYAKIVPWTIDFADEFMKRMGYDIADSLVQVFYNVGDTRKVRHDFWRVVTELYVEAFSKQIYDWCESHNLKLTGHQLLEDSLAVQIQHIGAVMPHYEYMQTPGIDHLCRQITNPELAKQVSSVSHQFGNRRVLSETFGASGWNLSFEDQKWIAEWQYVLGVNLMCQHLCLYSLRGWRKRDFPPSIYYQQPWWPQYNVVEDHFARLACALTSGKHVADVLLIHPMESAWAEYNPLQGGSETVTKLDNDFVAISQFLQEFHVDYDYGDESIMERHASIENGQVKVGDATYNLIVLPPTITLRRSTVDLLEKWIESGGNVIICGDIPTMIDGGETPELGVVLEDQSVVPVDFEALREAVYDMIEPQIQIFDEYGSDARSIYFQQRNLGEKQLFYMVNIDNTDVRYDAVIRFRGIGKVEEWDLDTGEIIDMTCREIGGYTVVERKFTPTQSHLLSFNPAQEPIFGDLEQWINVEEVDITGPWQIRRTDPNSITLDYCRYRIGDGKFSDLTPTIWLGPKLSKIEEYTPVTLRYTFNTDFFEQKQRNFTLAMERPDAYDISINGRQINYTDTGWWCDNSFKKIDIESYVQPGENAIEMTCSYLGENGRKKRQAELDIPSYWKRMWTNPPKDVKDPILLPYSGEVAEKIKEYNELKMGLDLESIYMLGDFGVYQTEPGKFILKDEQEMANIRNAVDGGYCFYRGTLVYECSFDYKHHDEDKLLLSMDKIGGIIARVIINDKEAGTIKWRPLEVDITNYIKPGSNSLRIEITNSCRNLLGPHHHVAGELTAVGPDSFNAEAGYVGIKDEVRGYASEEYLKAWTDNYSFVENGLIIAPKLIYMRKG